MKQRIPARNCSKERKELAFSLASDILKATPGPIPS